jgi:hypothetical protein
MKVMACKIIKFHHKEALEPYIEFGHNSDQCDQVIGDNIKHLVGGSMFIQGPLDANVSSLFMNELH